MTGRVLQVSEESKNLIDHLAARQEFIELINGIKNGLVNSGWDPTNAELVTIEALKMASNANKGTTHDTTS